MSGLEVTDQPLEITRALQGITIKTNEASGVSCVDYSFNKRSEVGLSKLGDSILLKLNLNKHKVNK